tara:strand:+ start:1424 stop:1567 length:144 start_codon:yes stop_codon:yes gene_type:complete
MVKPGFAVVGCGIDTSFSFFLQINNQGGSGEAKSAEAPLFRRKEGEI